MKLAERINGIKELPMTAQKMGVLMAFTLGIAIAAMVLASFAVVNGGRNAN